MPHALKGCDLKHDGLGENQCNTTTINLTVYCGVKYNVYTLQIETSLGSDTSCHRVTEVIHVPWPIITAHLFHFLLYKKSSAFISVYVVVWLPRTATCSYIHTYTYGLFSWPDLSHSVIQPNDKWHRHRYKVYV